LVLQLPHLIIPILQIVITAGTLDDLKAGVTLPLAWKRLSWFLFHGRAVCGRKKSNVSRCTGGNGMAAQVEEAGLSIPERRCGANVLHRRFRKADIVESPSRVKLHVF
jgi:hypothetical protein